MSIELIHKAIEKGAVLYPNISGGKDGQAMVKTMMNNKLPMAGLIHADLGRTEWPESMEMCERLARESGVELNVVRRSDGRDMIDHWKARMEQMKEQAWIACDVATRIEYEIIKPFWSSSKNRYCTSDMKRDPINKFYRNCGHDFVISCEGIRAQESVGRSKKTPLIIREKVTSIYYDGMTVEEAIEAYVPGKRLALTWYPIFHFSSHDVWQTYGKDAEDLDRGRWLYQQTGEVREDWPFHPAYIYGNNRVSCMFCILGCKNDLEVAAKHNPELLQTMIEMEEEGKATFKNKFSLTELL